MKVGDVLPTGSPYTLWLFEEAGGDIQLIILAQVNTLLRLMARVYVLDYSDQGYRYVLKLDCMAPGFEGDFLTIPMRKVGPNTFVRAHSRGESGYSFHLETASWGESAFYTVTLLTTMPSLTVRSPLSVARGSDLISYSRFTLVSIELPPDISIIDALETPVKFWDAEDRAFFGPHGSYQNWGAFVLETNNLFICFWHKEDIEWTFKASLLDMSRPEVYNLWKDLFLSAKQLGYQQTIVQYMLNSIEDEMESSVETHLKDKKITLSFKVWRAESQNLCSGPRWRVVFSRTSFVRDSSSESEGE
ncbi:hypothetical protein FOYG_03944 [Fusarium oxysporum NRRL 32931]|uniref:Uncharacterized protein n=1 Tax=Fusarium oxysporum NRRL 32931 TaxID=660029 RepID=W9J5F7_FUSOX|nr:hypothetical protein FOYG_03944 [Fusarium oxysporum NRRL 32931]